MSYLAETAAAVECEVCKSLTDLAGSQFGEIVNLQNINNEKDLKILNLTYQAKQDNKMKDIYLLRIENDRDGYNSTLDKINSKLDHLIKENEEIKQENKEINRKFTVLSAEHNNDKIVNATLIQDVAAANLTTSLLLETHIINLCSQILLFLCREQPKTFSTNVATTVVSISRFDKYRASCAVIAQSMATDEFTFIRDADDLILQRNSILHFSNIAMLESEVTRCHQLVKLDKHISHSIIKEVIFSLKLLDNFHAIKTCLDKY